MRRIKTAFDPAGHPQPRRHLRLIVPEPSTADPAAPPRERDAMNGAQALIRTLVDAGVDVCFMNPGTSEMHFVAALDDVPEMRGVLALFEGVATGAADGYARMAGQAGRRRCCTSAPASATAWPTCTTPARATPHREHRRRPRHLPQAVRRPARVRHRDGGPQRVDVDPHVRSHRTTSPPTPPRPWSPPPVRPAQVATLILPADV